MNKGDTPPRSIQDEEEYLQEEADIKEVEELEDGEIEIEWDGSEAELVPDEDAEEFEDNFAGIKLSYVLKEDEIYDALRSSKSYKSAQKRLIAESIISCILFCYVCNSDELVNLDFCNIVSYIGGCYMAGSLV